MNDDGLVCWFFLCCCCCYFHDTNRRNENGEKQSQATKVITIDSRRTSIDRNLLLNVQNSTETHTPAERLTRSQNTQMQFGFTFRQRATHQRHSLTVTHTPTHTHKHTASRAALYTQTTHLSFTLVFASFESHSPLRTFALCNVIVLMWRHYPAMSTAIYYESFSLSSRVTATAAPISSPPPPSLA